MTGPHDVFLRVAGLTAVLRTPSRAAARLARERWGPWLSKTPIRAPAVEVRGELMSRRRLREARRRDVPGFTPFSTPRFLWLLSREGCRGRALAARGTSAPYLYYVILEPLLHALMRRRGVFPLHGAGVARGDSSLLVLGRSGSGKSTSAALLMAAGMRLLSDDDILVDARGRAPRALGGEPGAYVWGPALGKLPDTGRLLPIGARRRGGKVKRLLGPAGAPAPRRFAAAVKKLIFPSVTKRAASSVRRLSGREALLRLLSQEPDYYPIYLGDRRAMERLFGFYHSLSRSAECYEVALGAMPSGLERVAGILARGVS